MRSSRVVLLLIAILSIGSHLYAQPPQDFNTFLLTEAANTPNPDRVRALAEGLKAFDRTTVFPAIAELETICKVGWQGQNAKALQALNSQGPVLDKIVGSFSEGAIVLPPTFPGDANAPVPMFLDLQLPAKLIAADGWMQLAGGKSDEAAMRGIEVLRLSETFRASPDQLFISHIFGVQVREVALDLLTAVVTRGNASKQTLQAIGTELYQADISEKQMADCILMAIPGDFATLQRSCQLALGDLQQAESEDPEVLRALQSVASTIPDEQVEAAYKEAREALREVLSKPYPERANEYADAYLGEIESETMRLLFQEFVAEPDKMLLHYRVSQARTRALTVLVALKLGNQQAANQFVDPFTGKPFMVTPARVYSLGPDQLDQQGMLQFDPKQGSTSPGDIVVMR